MINNNMKYCIMENGTHETDESIKEICIPAEATSVDMLHVAVVKTDHVTNTHSNSNQHNNDHVAPAIAEILNNDTVISYNRTIPLLYVENVIEKCDVTHASKSDGILNAKVPIAQEQTVISSDENPFVKEKHRNNKYTEIQDKTTSIDQEESKNTKKKSPFVDDTVISEDKTLRINRDSPVQFSMDEYMNGCDGILDGDDYRVGDDEDDDDDDTFSTEDHHVNNAVEFPIRFHKTHDTANEVMEIENNVAGNRIEIHEYKNGRRRIEQSWTDMNQAILWIKEEIANLKLQDKVLLGKFLELRAAIRSVNGKGARLRALSYGGREDSKLAAQRSPSASESNDEVCLSIKHDSEGFTPNKQGAHMSALDEFDCGVEFRGRTVSCVTPRTHVQEFMKGGDCA